MHSIVAKSPRSEQLRLGTSMFPFSRGHRLLVRFDLSIVVVGLRRLSAHRGKEASPYLGNGNAGPNNLDRAKCLELTARNA